jgi:hypothetical protein
MSYLRLMKSIWIMDRIRESDDWRKMQRTNPGGLYDRCVREMDRVSTKSTNRLPGGETEDFSSDYVPNAAMLLEVECRVRNSPWCCSYQKKHF